MEKTLESPLDCKEIQPVHLEGHWSWIAIGRTDAEAETPILWPPDTKNWLIGKDPDAGKNWRLKEKGTTEDEMVGWHHWLAGHEFEQALGVGVGQRSLAFCSPWGCKELDTTEQLNWSAKDVYLNIFWFNSIILEPILNLSLFNKIKKTSGESKNQDSNVAMIVEDMWWVHGDQLYCSLYSCVH